LQGLSAVYLAFWIVAAISPLDRQTWLLENVLVFALVGVLVGTHRRFVFSNLSYVLIFVFLMLHAVGAHYTYSEVPIGDWIQQRFGLSRNHYDRTIHFSFGLLLAYPLREMVLRRAHAHGVWSFALPVLVTLGLSASYEIAEWWAARVVDPQVGMAYVGAQGDSWDGQKDMCLALAGAVMAMLIVGFHRHRTGAEPYLGRGSRHGPAEN